MMETAASAMKWAFSTVNVKLPVRGSVELRLRSLAARCWDRCRGEDTPAESGAWLLGHHLVLPLQHQTGQKHN